MKEHTTSGLEPASRPGPGAAPLAAALNSVRLGRTDVWVSELGIGTWQWGDSVIWGYGKNYGEADIRAAFDAGMAAGVRFFDTAEVYGQGKSERYLGEFISRDGDRPVVASKFMPLPWRLTRPAMLRALRNSLERLGLARLDLYQVHWPFPLRSIEEWADALADMVEAGLTRAAGVSNYSAAQMRRAHEVLARRGVPLGSNQVQYSLLDRRPERNGVLDACRELGITLIAYSPLAKGLLTGKYGPGNPPPGLIRRSAHLARIQPLVGLLREIGQAHGGKTPAQVALNWVICKGAIPIPGAKNAQQAQDNAAAMGWRLAEDELAALDWASAAVTARPS